MFTSLKQKYYRFGNEKALLQMKTLIESNPDLKAQYIELSKAVENEIGEYKKFANEQQLKEIEAALIFLDKSKLQKAIKALKKNITIDFYSMSDNTKNQEQQQKTKKKVLQHAFLGQKTGSNKKCFVIKSKNPLDISKAGEAFTDFRCEMCSCSKLVYFEAIGAFVCSKCFPQSDVAIEVKSYVQPVTNEYVYELYPTYRYRANKNFEDKTTKSMAAI